MISEADAYFVDAEDEETAEQEVLSEARRRHPNRLIKVVNVTEQDSVINLTEQDRKGL